MRGNRMISVSPRVVFAATGGALAASFVDQKFNTEVGSRHDVTHAFGIGWEAAQTFTVGEAARSRRSGS